MSHCSCLPGLLLSQTVGAQKGESLLQSPGVSLLGSEKVPTYDPPEERAGALVCWEGLGPAAGWKFGWEGALSGTPASDSLPEILSKPIIWAKPDFMIPKGTRVSILCQGTPEAVEYQLYFEGHLSAQRSPKQLGRRNIAMFHIPAMTPHTAGQYKCVYRRKKLWSEPSDPLDLVVTGNCPILGLNPGEGHIYLLISLSVIQPHSVVIYDLEADLS